MKNIGWLITAIAAFGVGCLFGYIRFGIANASDFKDITIPFLSMLGSWFSALGTLLAVVISLYFAMKANRENTEHIKVNAKIITLPPFRMRTIAESESHQERMEINIVNIHHIRCEIQGVSMRFSANKKEEFDMELVKTGSFSLPMILADRGQSCRFFFRFGDAAHSWAFFTSIEGKFDGGNLGKPELIIHSTTKEYEVPLSADVQTFILKAYQDFLQGRKIQ